MRSAEILRLSILLVCVWAASPGSAWGQGSTPSSAEVREAREKLATDPDLHPKKTVRTLKSESRETSSKSPDVAWLYELARFIANAGRVLIWVFGAAAVLLVLWGLRRWIQVRGIGLPQRRLVDLPTHVADLDIRPQSLPEHPGQVAWSLWQRGEQRAALSLLYRATLSRLVHEYAVPITASSTEGECLRLARNSLASAQWVFVEKLISVWLTTIYGNKRADGIVVQQLCAGLDTELKASRMAGGLS